MLEHSPFICDRDIEFVVPDNLEEQLTAFYKTVNPEKVNKVVNL